MFSKAGPQVLAARGSENQKEKTLHILQQLRDLTISDDEDEIGYVNSGVKIPVLDRGSTLVPKPLAVCGAYCYISVNSYKPNKNGM